MGGPVRVLHTVVNMNRGGAETLIMNLYRHVDRSKVQFDFLTCRVGAFDEEISQMGGKLHRIPYVTDVGHFGYMKALDQFFASHPEYRVVHAHMDKMSGWVLRSAKKAGVIARLAHSHGTRSEGGYVQRVYKWLSGKYIPSSATHLFACSTPAADWLFSHHAKKAFILKNGVDSYQFAFSSEIRNQMRAALRIPDHSFVIGHVGRFDKPKNHPFLIDLFARLIIEKPNSTLVLVGDGPLRFEMENKVKALNLSEQVMFLGIRSDIANLLHAFDAFVFPSIHEGLPVTLIEAQGAGLSCLISDTITREVDMGMGLVDFVPLGDKMLWVNKIKALAETNKPRKHSSDALTRKGYDIKQTAGWTEDFYLEVCAR